MIFDFTLQVGSDREYILGSTADLEARRLVFPSKTPKLVIEEPSLALSTELIELVKFLAGKSTTENVCYLDKSRNGLFQ